MTQPLHSLSQTTSIDQPYTFGREPSTYLATREMVRLTLLRSRIEPRHELRNRRYSLASRRSRVQAA